MLSAGSLLVIFTAYFGFEMIAGFERLSGEAAYYKGDFNKAWMSYGRALRFGAERPPLEIDQVQMLLFALDQKSLGVKVDLPMSPAEAVMTLRALLGHRLNDSPYSAYQWSLASDLYLYEARETRRQTPLDLSTLSDDPVKNLLPQEGLAIAALLEASRREPTNYVYHDLIAENYIEWGMTSQALEHVRRAVALYPVYNAHLYLGHPPVDADLLQAAVDGYEDALHEKSLFGRQLIECDAGWLLSRQPAYADAARFFRRAIQDAPGMADALFGLGVASYWLGQYAEAEEALVRAAVSMPEAPHLYYYLGLARMKLGKKTEAIEALRTARELNPHLVEFFHTLAEALESEGQIKDAERQYLAAANLNPDSAEAWSALLAYYGRHTELRGGARRTCAHLAGTKIDPAVYKSACDSILRGLR
jgi:tetratricopeptide (TPR) repeat protein